MSNQSLRSEYSPARATSSLIRSRTLWYLIASLIASLLVIGKGESPAESGMLEPHALI